MAREDVVSVSGDDENELAFLKAEGVLEKIVLINKRVIGSEQGQAEKDIHDLLLRLETMKFNDMTGIAVLNKHPELLSIIIWRGSMRILEDLIERGALDKNNSELEVRNKMVPGKIQEKLDEFRKDVLNAAYIKKFTDENTKKSYATEIDKIPKDDPRKIILERYLNNLTLAAEEIDAVLKSEPNTINAAKTINSILGEYNVPETATLLVELYNDLRKDYPNNKINIPVVIQSAQYLALFNPALEGLIRATPRSHPNYIEFTEMLSASKEMLEKSENKMVIDSRQLKTMMDVLSDKKVGKNTRDKLIKKSVLLVEQSDLTLEDAGVKLLIDNLAKEIKGSGYFERARKTNLISLSSQLDEKVGVSVHKRSASESISSVSTGSDPESVDSLSDNESIASLSSVSTGSDPESVSSLSKNESITSSLTSQSPTILRQVKEKIESLDKAMVKSNFQINDENTVLKEEVMKLFQQYQALSEDQKSALSEEAVSLFGSEGISVAVEAALKHYLGKFEVAEKSGPIQGESIPIPEDMLVEAPDIDEMLEPMAATAAPLPTNDDIEKLGKELEAKRSSDINQKIDDILKLQSEDSKAAYKATRELLSSKNQTARLTLVTHPQLLERLIENGNQSVLKAVEDSRVLSSHFWEEKGASGVQGELKDLLKEEISNYEAAVKTFAESEPAEKFIIAQTNGLIGKMIDDILENVNQAEKDKQSYLSAIKNHQQLSVGMKQILSSKVAAQDPLPDYNAEVFLQKLDQAAKALPKDKIIPPKAFAGAYAEVLKAFEDMPGLSEMRPQVEAMMIAQNLNLLVQDHLHIDQQKAMGEKNVVYFEDKLVQQPGNDAQKQKDALGNLRNELKDAIRDLQALKKMMNGSSPEVKQAMADQSVNKEDLNRFNQAVDRRLMELGNLEVEMVRFRQQMAAKQEPVPVPAELRPAEKSEKAVDSVPRTPSTRSFDGGPARGR